MKITLAREHRKTLETVFAQARGVAESGEVNALQALAVGAKEAPWHFTNAQKNSACDCVRTGGILRDCLPIRFFSQRVCQFYKSRPQIPHIGN